MRIRALILVTAGLVICLLSTGLLSGCGSRGATSSDDASSDATLVPEDALPSLENEPIRALDDTLTMYTYDDMKHDMQVLCYKYPDLVAADVLTSTVDGRDMDHLIIGDP